MYGKNLSGHTSLVLRPIKALLLLLFPAFEGLHDNIKFVITACIQRKLFKGNDRQGEREQTIGKHRRPYISRHRRLQVDHAGWHMRLGIGIVD